MKILNVKLLVILALFANLSLIQAARNTTAARNAAANAAVKAQLARGEATSRCIQKCADTETVLERCNVCYRDPSKYK